MKNLKTIVVIIFAFLLCFGCANNTSKKQQTTPKQAQITWTMETYAINGGWGYFIYCNGEKMINQDQIPAIPGKHPFSNQKLAKKTAELVIQKLNTQKLPSITQQELIQLGVVDSLLNPIK